MIKIEEININNKNNFDNLKNEFEINTILFISLDHNKFSYSEITIPKSYNKKYDFDKIDIEDYVLNSDKTIFFAFFENTFVGQIRIRKNWNNYCYIEDILVDEEFRRKNIGKTLIKRAEDWAKNKELKGIMLETQNNNFPACKLYESCGFQIGGIDLLLYKGINSESDEIAVYWYKLF